MHGTLFYTCLGAGIMAALAALVLGVLVAVRPVWVRRWCERLWALAWAVETGSRTYHVKRREAVQGGLKVKLYGTSGLGTSGTSLQEVDLVRDITEALVGLGSSRAAAKITAGKVLRRNPQTVSLEYLMREAIREQVQLRRGSGPGWEAR